MSKRDDKQRKAMFAKINKNGVTQRKFKRLEDLPKDFKERYNKKHTGKGYPEKKVPTLTKNGVVDKAPKHRNAALIAANKKFGNTLIVPMMKQNQIFMNPIELPLSILKTAVKFAVPIAPVIGEMIGLEEPALITRI